MQLWWRRQQGGVGQGPASKLFIAVSCSFFFAFSCYFLPYLTVSGSFFCRFLSFFAVSCHFLQCFALYCRFLLFIAVSWWFLMILAVSCGFLWFLAIYFHARVCPAIDVMNWQYCLDGQCCTFLALVFFLCVNCWHISDLGDWGIFIRKLKPILSVYVVLNKNT